MPGPAVEMSSRILRGTARWVGCSTPQPNCRLPRREPLRGNSIFWPRAPGCACVADQAPRYQQPRKKQPDETPPDAGQHRPARRRRSRGWRRPRPEAARSARTTATAGRSGTSWRVPGARAGRREDRPGDPGAHPRSARPGPAPSARRNPRPSACPPGSAHPGPTRPHHGRNRKPSSEQEDNSPSWRSSCSRLSDSYHQERVSHVSNVLDKSHRHHCRMPPARADICHGPAG